MIIDWILDIKEYLIRKQVYEIAAICRDIERENLGKNSELTEGYFNGALMRIFHNQSPNLLSKIVPDIMEISKPHIRGYKINQILS